jgi:hypothetical protein
MGEQLNTVRLRVITNLENEMFNDEFFATVAFSDLDLALYLCGISLHGYRSHTELNSL